MERKEHIYIVLDALDECSDRIKLLGWLKNVTETRGKNLHLLMTSREERDIDQSLRSIPEVVGRCLNDEPSNDDISSYIDWFLSVHYDLRDINESMQNEVKRRLLEKSSGMFRWVALQLDELKDCYSQQNVREQLDELPNNLEETYQRILIKINKKSRGDAQKLLVWLSFAFYSFTLEELAEVVCISTNSEKAEFSDARRIKPEVVLSICGGLVTQSNGIPLTIISLGQVLILFVYLFRLCTAISFISERLSAFYRHHRRVSRFIRY
ncbi:hypothetical protein M422DRAFT_188004 [Sphaerobolus stellatus SS14]|uniref:Nephrocystin 3-like N-terminal domain-containing protein n=1 Tax=Sphaerobolus stellatus (strain SS14) TaxID=990650 RepID=A0A0C9UWR5_SPHS4|nr:hypothetical protein M422DRAFT_188004 [Sphaerobolus stellatus SS14]